MIEILNKPDESTVNDSKKFTGVIPYTVIAINPTLEQLHEVGLTYLKNEPSYTSSYGDKTSTRIDIWLKSTKDPKLPDLDVITKVAFFINHDVFVGSNSGKTQYVNKYGRTAWAMDQSELKTNPYYIDEGSRPAHQGEELLYKFLFSWLNMSYDPERKMLNPCRLDISKVFEGDFSELQGIVPKASAYVVKALTGIRKYEKDDGSINYYQVVYNKYFLKHNQKSLELFQNFINKDENNAFKDADYYTLHIEEFDPSKVVIPDSDTVPAGNVSISVGDEPF